MSNISLDYLRKNKTKIFDNTKKTFEKKEGFKRDDDGFFKPTYDGNGKATVVMRFLPPSANDFKELGSEAPNIITMISYGFKHKPTGRWYINESAASIGLEDPIYKLRKLLWDAGFEDEARPLKRKTQYITNVYIVKNQNNPSQEGQVFKWSFGKKIYEKIQAAINPPEELGEDPIEVFDLDNAPNFNLIAFKEKKEINGNSVEVPNYDTSTFATKSGAIAKTDEEIAEIWSKVNDLVPYTKPDYYPTEEKVYEDIKRVFGDKYPDAIKEGDISIAKGKSHNTPSYEESDDFDLPSSNSNGNVNVDADEDDSINQDIDDILSGLDS